VLSQRTVGKFQRLLEELLRRQFYGESPALTPRSYYTMLYEADVPGELLDLLATRTAWDPAVLVRALHEGVAIAQIRGKAPYNGASGRDQAVGDVYLLCFAAVALSRYEQLDYDHRAPFEDSARALMESLLADGYRYERGTLINSASEVVKPIPLNEKQIKAIAVPEFPKQVAEVVTDTLELDENPPSPQRERRSPWTRDQKLIVWGIVATILVGTAATIVTALAIPDFRSWLTDHLHKLLIRVH
jgi:hypothetical protein